MLSIKLFPFLFLRQSFTEQELSLKRFSFYIPLPQMIVTEMCTAVGMHLGVCFTLKSCNGRMCILLNQGLRGYINTELAPEHRVIWGHKIIQMVNEKSNAAPP